MMNDTKWPYHFRFMVKTIERCHIFHTSSNTEREMWLCGFNSAIEE